MTEDQIQIQILQWVKLNHPSLTVFHIPNGGKRNIIEASKLKSMGVMAGAADLYFMDFKLFMELKRDESKHPTQEQYSFRDKCFKTGHEWVCAYGFEEDIMFIKTYVKIFDK